jgi:hypothetical protein
MAFGFMLLLRRRVVQQMIALLGGLVWASLSVIAEEFFMPRCDATTPSSSPPYALRKGEKDLSPLPRGTPGFVRQGVCESPPLDPLLANEGKSFSRESQPRPSTESHEIAWLRAQLAAQQAQIDQLRKELQEQRAWLQQSRVNVATSASSSPGGSDLAAGETGQPARSAPVKPVVVANATSATPSTSQLLSDGEPKTSPLSFGIGSTRITPVGFMDFTAVFRSKNVGSGLGTSFGTVPFEDSVNGNLWEYRLSAQNSRLGARLDSNVKGFDVLGYVETDFLGFVPGNSAVTTNSNSLRLRLYWARLSKSKFEILAGQSWSMLTPNRRGISPLPGDLFLTQDTDPNIQVGMTWARSPQLRFVFHPSETVSVGFSTEAAEQYAGGSAGSAAITLPSALVSSYSGQLNTGSSGLSVPSPNQDLVGKVAFDHKAGGRPFHIELAAILRRFKFYNPLSQQSYRAAGGGGSLNLNVELVKNLRLLSNNFYSEGGGRYIFGQGPDLIIQGDGSPSLVHAYSMVHGFEYQARPKTLFFAYYGGAYFQKNVAIDPETGGPVGYGYAGSPSEHNRSLQQVTAGFAHTFWRDPAYGALQFMTQYSYLFRQPWYVAPARPGEANLNMLYLNLRYTLPGAPPGAR